MRKVLGGNDEGTGEIGGGARPYLVCTTPNGQNRWYRPSCNFSTANADCIAIYPAYSSGVSGECVIEITP